MTPQMMASLSSTMIGMLGPVVQTIETASHTPPDVVTKVQQAMDGMRDATQQIAQAEGASSTLPLLDRIEADANVVLTAAVALPLPASVIMGLRMAGMLLPMIAGMASLVQASIKNPAAMPATPG